MFDFSSYGSSNNCTIAQFGNKDIQNGLKLTFCFILHFYVRTIADHLSL